MVGRAPDGIPSAARILRVGIAPIWVSRVEHQGDSPSSGANPVDCRWVGRRGGDTIGLPARSCEPTPTREVSSRAIQPTRT